MSDYIKPEQIKKSLPPAVWLAVKTLAHVQKDAAELAVAWRSKLPALALDMERTGREISADKLEQIVRENWDAAHIKSLFDGAAGEVFRPAKLTYEGVVASFPLNTKPEPPLAESTEAESLETAKQQLAVKDYDRFLQFSAKNGFLSVVQYLLEKDGERADIHADYDEVLQLASKYGHLSVVRYLLEKDGEKANIHVMGNWVLHLASKYGHLNVVQYLLEKDGEKADIHAVNDWALSRAAEHNQLSVVQYLLEKDGEKADIHALNEIALRIAAGNGHLSVVRYLLEKDGEKADVHADNDYALRTAAENGHLSVVRHLLEKDGGKADIHAHNDEGLRIAAVNGHLSVVQYLLEKNGEKADIHADNDFALLAAAFNGELSVVRYLLEKDGEKADIHAANDLVLSRAAWAGHLDVVQYLLEKDGEKADIHAHNDGALYSAGVFGQLSIVRYLLEKDGEKADIHAHNDEVLRGAAWKGHLNVVQYLLEKDGERTEIHTDNDYALCISAQEGWLNVVKYLLEKDGEKADIHAHNDDVLSLAVSHCQLNVVQYLLKRWGKFLELAPDERSSLDQALTSIKHWQQVTGDALPEGELWRNDPEGVNPSALFSFADLLQCEGCTKESSLNYAYELTRLFDDEQQVLRYLQRWGRAGKQPLHDVIQMIHCPQRQTLNDSLPRWNRKAWADAVMAQGPKMAKLVKFAACIIEDGTPIEPARTKDGTVSLNLTIKHIGQFAYSNGGENPEFAALCFAHMLEEQTFTEGLKIIQETPKDVIKNIPDIELDGKELGLDGLHWRRLPPGDPKGLLLGEYTDCCQSIGSNGAACAKHGYQSPDGGFYVVEDSKGTIIGETWAWRGTKGELVLDSIETLGQRISSEAWKKLIAAFAARLKKNPGDVTALHIGCGGRTPSNLKLKKTKAVAQPKDYSGYRDSNDQFHVQNFTPRQTSVPNLDTLRFG